MIVCNICRKDVSVLERDQRVFGLLPVEVGEFSYNNAEWQRTGQGSYPSFTDESSGMAYFLHGSCLDRVVQIARQPIQEKN